MKIDNFLKPQNSHLHWRSCSWRRWRSRQLRRYLRLLVAWVGRFGRGPTAVGRVGLVVDVPVGLCVVGSGLGLLLQGLGTATA